MSDNFLPNSGLLTQTNNRLSWLYNNPHFDYLSEQLPKNHKELFKWCEVVFYNSPVLMNGVKKLVSYPITNFTYKTGSDKIEEETREFVENVLDLKTHLINLGLDFYTYGNVFRNIYFPFTRFLRCPVCGQQVNVVDSNYKFKRGQFVLNCGSCRATRTAEIVDEYTQDFEGIRLVTWDPKQIELLMNPITGSTAYYYALAKDIQSGILSGEPIYVDTLPQVFLDAFRGRKNVYFSNNFYHLKAPTIAGFRSGWGIPPLVATLKLYLYVAILRKSNEAIGLEHITPKNIVFPQATSNDPTISSSMSSWRAQIERAFMAWRRDPNYTMIAPYPTGVANIGSQGKVLMVSREIKEAQEDMIRALDVPVEFVFGMNNIHNSWVLLRILENQLQPYMSQIRKYANWIINMANAKYDKHYCEIDFTPFKLADDIEHKQLLMNMMGQGVSKTTVQEVMGLNPQDERDKAQQEAVEAYRDQKELESEQHQMDNSISAQVSQDQVAQDNSSVPQYDQRKVVAQAQQLAQQLLSVPYEERRGYLAQLSNEDYVMYSVVKSQLDSMKEAVEPQPTGQI